MHKQAYWFNNTWIRITLHLLFVAISFLILLNLFRNGIHAEQIDFIYTAFFLGSILPAVYINLKILLPLLAKNKKWHWYILSVTAMIVAFTWLNLRFFQTWSYKLLPDLFFISYYVWWEIAIFFIAFIGLTTLLKLSKSWLTVSELERQLLTSEKQKVQLELKALKAQINPHFFFNTLNSIYSLSLDKDDKLPGTILQLSEIMRYYLYESQEDFVPLEKELQILEDYISLQKIRSNEKLQVNTSIEGNIKNEKIAPLILITFLENAFKHGAKASTFETFINLKIQLVNDTFHFSIENNKGLVDDIESNEYKGVGLENVRRRLSLLYPGKHSLKIHNEPDRFIVQLQIQL